MKDFAEKGARH